jgi:hypothetical protein
LKIVNNNIIRDAFSSEARRQTLPPLTVTLPSATTSTQFGISSTPFASTTPFWDDPANLPLPLNLNPNLNLNLNPILGSVINPAWIFPVAKPVTPPSILLGIPLKTAKNPVVNSKPLSLNVLRRIQSRAPPHRPLRKQFLSNSN